MKHYLVAGLAGLFAFIGCATAQPVINRISDINDARALRSAANGQVPVWNTVSNRWFPGNLAAATNTASAGADGSVQISSGGVLTADSDLTFVTDTLFATKFSSSAITNTALSSGQIVYSDANKKMVGNSYFLLDPSTLQVTLGDSATATNVILSRTSMLFSTPNGATINMDSARTGDARTLGTITYSGVLDDSSVATLAGIIATKTDDNATTPLSSLTLRFYSASGYGDQVVIGPATLASSVPVTVPDDAYAAGWDGSTAVPTKNAVYDKIQAIVGASGDDVYVAGANVSNPNFVAGDNIGIAVSGTNVTTYATNLAKINAVNTFTGASNVFDNIVFLKGGANIEGTGGTILDAATITNLNIITALTNTFLTATRVPFSSATKTLTDDADLTFSGDTLTGTIINATTGFKVNTSFGSAGQVLTSTGSASAWSNVVATVPDPLTVTNMNVSTLTATNFNVVTNAVGFLTVTNGITSIHGYNRTVYDTTNYWVDFNKSHDVIKKDSGYVNFAYLTNVPSGSNATAFPSFTIISSSANLTCTWASVVGTRMETNSTVIGSNKMGWLFFTINRLGDVTNSSYAFQPQP